MASPEQIIDVREKTNETTSDPWTDEDINSLVDLLGVDRAAASIWRKKAASYSDLVNTSEAGASQALGDLYKRAMDMASFYEESQDGESPEVDTIGHAVVSTIVRAT